MRQFYLVILMMLYSVDFYAQITDQDKIQKKWYRAASESYMMREIPLALKYCDSLLMVQPHNCKYLSLKGGFLIALENYSESEKILMHALELGCDSVKIFLKLQSMQLSTNNYKKAIYYLDCAIKIKPDSADLYIDKAFIYTILKDRKNDKKNLLKAKSLGSSRAEYLLKVLEDPKPPPPQ